MENKNQNESFHFRYSAAEQEEIKKIREKYTAKEPDTMERLRALDESVTKKGALVALIVGVLGTLILGVGMCCVMVWGDTLFLLGIPVGLLGIVGVALAYPLYAHITKKERERIAPEIIRLTDELLK